MLRPLMICTICIAGSTAIAAPLDVLDMDLRLDSIGFSAVTIYDDELVAVDNFHFLDIQDDVWGIAAPLTSFEIGEQVAIKAETDGSDPPFNSCSIGGFSCDGAFGQLNDDSFSIGDGSGLTSLGDFNLEGGRNVGDNVTLSTFSGGLTYQFLADGGYITWDTYVHNFNVADDNLANGLTLGVVPLPASLILLIAGLGGLGFVGRRARNIG